MAGMFGVEAVDGDVLFAVDLEGGCGLVEPEVGILCSGFSYGMLMIRHLERGFC